VRDLQPNTTWLTNNFEPIRAEAWPDAPESLLVCCRCGANVFRYAAAWHLNWHERIDPHSPAARDMG
jgi:hypothetical protein